jgi:phosphate uptake regulator|tara:strand:+ start:357 stop:1256 length:900 start_codon:yes stop_codon:yes gene_type:complete
LRRKLVKQAGQAFTLTLPIDWIRNNGLEAGDEVNLIDRGKSILVKSGKKTVTGIMDFNIKGFSKRMKYTYINSAYALGVDEIDLETEEGYFHDLSQNMGFALVSQKGEKSIIKDLGGVAPENMDEIFKRAFQMLMEFYDKASDDIFEGNKESIKILNKIDGEINKFTLFVERSIMKLSYPSSTTGRIMFAYSFELEKMGDEILRLWRSGIKLKIEKSKKVKDIVQLGRDALQKSFEVYYQTNHTKIKELFEIKDLVKVKLSKLGKIDSDTMQFLMHAVKIIDDSCDLIQLALMRKIKPR